MQNLLQPRFSLISRVVKLTEIKATCRYRKFRVNRVCNIERQLL